MSTKQFKNASGSYYLKQIFFETAETDRTYVLYTLKDEDHRGYPSLRRLYLEMGDESEYVFANTYFGGWPHWKRLLNCNWFMDYLSSYREELVLRQQAESLVRLRTAARDGRLDIDKWLIERKWDKDPVGRPSKERIKREAQQMTREAVDVSDDLARLTEGTIQ